MPRLFTALQLPSDISTSLSFLRGGIYGARWIEPESYHITLRFIGDVEGHIADEISKALDQINGRPIRIRLSRLDVFGNSKPHSLHAVVEHNSDLEKLRKSHDRIAQMIGLAPDRRRFSPHVTLARLKGANTADLAEYLSRNGGYASSEFKISHYVLFSARASTGGGPYVVEESYELAA